MKRLFAVFIMTVLLFCGCSKTDTEPNPQISPVVDPSVSSQPADTLPADTSFVRIFDSDDMQEKCRTLLNVFAPCSRDNWDGQNNDKLLNTVYFEHYIERLYYYDTGKTFEHDDKGYTALENYTTYGAKYFNLTEEQIRKQLAKSNIYNAENDTVFMSDGIGCVIGLEFIDVTYYNNDYYIDYAILYPEQTQYEYGKLKLRENDDGSFKFLSNEYTGSALYPSYNLVKHNQPFAKSKDNKYELYYGNKFGKDDYSAQEIVLKDTYANKYKSLGFITKNLISDAGFFSNGDVYTMDYYGLNVYDIDMNNSEIVFSTKTNFKAGVNIGFYDKSLFAVRRDPETFEYTVIYAEHSYAPDIKLNDFQLDTCYKIGLLDKDGNLIKSWDTDVPVMYSAFGYESVYLTKPSENEIEFFVKYKDEERLRGRFNFENGAYTPIKNFSVAADEELEKVKQIAEEQIQTVGLMLGTDWDDRMNYGDNFYISLVANLAYLYYYDNGVEISTVEAAPNDYLVTDAYRISDLMSVANKYYCFDSAQLEEFLRSQSSYNPENDSVFLGDGFGWMMHPEITSVNRAGSNYAIHYNLCDTEYNIYRKDCMATAILTNGGYLKFITNYCGEIAG